MVYEISSSPKVKTKKRKKKEGEVKEDERKKRKKDKPTEKESSAESLDNNEALDNANTNPKLDPTKLKSLVQPSIMAYVSPQNRQPQQTQQQQPQPQQIHQPQLLVTPTTLSRFAKVITQTNSPVFGEECFITCDDEHVTFSRWSYGNRFSLESLYFPGEGVSHPR